MLFDLLMTTLARLGGSNFTSLGIFVLFCKFPRIHILLLKLTAVACKILLFALNVSQSAGHH